jgi:23S rRNA (cytidine1920-2'-O)/16S rRNA (cytidine1409-2'-O)-methyltransferase
VASTSKQRADILLVEQGLAESRNMAQRLVMAGQVRVNGEILAKSSEKLAIDTVLEVKELPRFVSRGAHKLEAALNSFGVEVTHLICADVGASTGGFTDCLLQYGAKKVYAIDVGSKQLHWKLRSDDRVIVMEQTNARHLQALPELMDFVSIDASFISLKLLLPQVVKWLQPQGEVIALIKPQFEAGKEEADKGKGVIRDPNVHKRVLWEILLFAQEGSFFVLGLMLSPVRGPKGNREFLVHLAREGEDAKDLEILVKEAVEQVKNED